MKQDRNQQREDERKKDKNREWKKEGLEERRRRVKKDKVERNDTISLQFHKKCWI